MKIVVIGGASTYTPELIDGFIARAGVLPLREIWLVDPNEERLKIVGAFAQRMVKQANAPFRVAPEQVYIEQVGLNHLNWIRRISIGGDDATEEVLKVYAEHLRHDEDEIHFPPFLIDTLHAIPSSYLEYFYLKSQVVAHQAS